jgi:hypothetical protein
MFFGNENLKRNRTNAMILLSQKYKQAKTAQNAYWTMESTMRGSTN